MNTPVSPRMLVAFRVDSAVSIGTGHVMRCLTLATELRAAGAKVIFLCRPLTGDSIEQIRRSCGFEVHTFALELSPKSEATAACEQNWRIDAESSRHALQKWVQRNTQPTTNGRLQADWLIVDHYGLDGRWEDALRTEARQILVIDDIANRDHSCDVLLDQNLCHNPNRRYANLVPDDCKLLLGPRYALLRPEFRKARESVLACTHKIPLARPQRLFIFFGGTDPSDETSKAVSALMQLPPNDFEAEVVVGESNPNREKVRIACGKIPGVRFHCQVDNMAELMAASDLAIGAGGSTTWERCCIGLPSLIAVLADNQAELSETAHAKGLAVNLGQGTHLTPEDYLRAVRAMSPDALKTMKGNCLELVDGLGSARVTDYLLKA